jgi:hypothetical protein
MPERKIRTDLTGRHDLTVEEIIRGLTPPVQQRPTIVTPARSPIIDRKPKRPIRQR